MNRSWYVFGCTLFSLTSALAQDNVPAARLGTPAATLGRPMPPLIIRAAAPDDPKAGEPKTMPKAGVTEAPKAGILPMPMEMNPALSGVGPTPLPMGAVVPGVTGPVVTQGPALGGTIIPQPPIPNGLMPAPNGALPCENCPTPIFATPAPKVDRWYTSAEFLIWYVRSYTVPALVTVGPQGSIGATGEPGVSTVFGGGDLIKQNPRYGGRIGVGYWFTPKWAIEASMFFLPTTAENFSVSSDQYPNNVIARPFFSLNQNTEFAEQVANPGIYQGYVSVDSRSYFWGIEGNFRRKMWDWNGGNTRIDALFGYRYLSLREELDIREQTLGLRGAPQQFVGVERAVADSFRTRNHFHGGQIGAMFEHRWGRWTIDIRAKVALGVTLQDLEVSGTTAVIQGGLAPSRPGGLLALDSNVGDYSRNPFAIVPEGTINLGYDLTPNIRLFVGYNFMYWSSVIRPGSQIDRTLDEHRIPDFTLGRVVPAANAVRPITRIEPESFWAMGLNFGISFRW